MSPPRICIVGLGAVGGLFAARLARAGQPVSALARGATLAAVSRSGLELVERSAAGEEHRSRVALNVAREAAELGEQDVVVLSVKTTSLGSVAPTIAPLIGPRTVLLSAMNGVPWWFFHGLAPAMAAQPLRAIDPRGAIAAALPPGRVVGMVVHLAASTPAPGVVRHAMGERLIVGAPGGATAGLAGESVAPIAEAFSRAGFAVETSARIEQEVWYKLWGNCTMNPLSAVTGATLDVLLDDPLLRGFASRVMREAAEIGARIGLPIDADPEERHEVTRKLGAVRTSMLQDVEGRRPIELDALVGAVAEIGQRVGVATPFLDALLGVTRVRARVLGVYPGPAG